MEGVRFGPYHLRSAARALSHTPPAFSLTSRDADQSREVQDQPDNTTAADRLLADRLLPTPPEGIGASDGQMKIVRDCLRSLARSKE